MFKKLRLWFQENVLKKEYYKYRVYYVFLGLGLHDNEVIFIEEIAKSKADAKKKANEYIKENANPGARYTFVKVEKV
ncbi:hypothetical protein [Mammaliicoccus phage vB_MscM-PMS3]|nr:hypothetical protein [Mammaliicoccus phage vB_MscM-PMS3]WBF82135.1 hypothetical protein [Mammaliicoccus virus vB_MscM-PMS2]